MRIRTTVILVATVAAGLSAPASAATKPRRLPAPKCPLVVDPDNDTKYLYYNVPMVRLDVKSANVGTNIGLKPNTFGASLSIADLDGTADPSAVMNRVYRVMWKGDRGKDPNAYYALEAAISSSGTATFSMGKSAGSQSFTPLQGATVNGTVDIANNEIRMWVPISGLAVVPGAGALKYGSKIHSIMAETFTSNGWNFDRATGDSKSFTYAGAPKTCLKIGS